MSPSAGIWLFQELLFHCGFLLVVSQKQRPARKFYILNFLWIWNWNKAPYYMHVSGIRSFQIMQQLGRMWYSCLGAITCSEKVYICLRYLLQNTGLQTKKKVGKKEIKKPWPFRNRETILMWMVTNADVFWSVSHHQVLKKSHPYHMFHVKMCQEENLIGHPIFSSIWELLFCSFHILVTVHLHIPCLSIPVAKIVETYFKIFPEHA